MANSDIGLPADSGLGKKIRTTSIQEVVSGVTVTREIQNVQLAGTDGTLATVDSGGLLVKISNTLSDTTAANQTTLNNAIGAANATAWDGAASSATAISIFKYLGSKIEAVRALLAGMISVVLEGDAGAGTNLSVDYTLGTANTVSVFNIPDSARGFRITNASAVLRTRINAAPPGANVAISGTTPYTLTGNYNLVTVGSTEVRKLVAGTSRTLQNP